MEKNEILEMFDYEKYNEVMDITNPYNLEFINDYEILYYLKSKLVLDNFKINDKNEIKKLLFYYFYLLWAVEFENDYNFSFKKDLLNISFNNFEDETSWLSNFKQYFDLWKNEIFLNKIVDSTSSNKLSDYRDWAFEVDNLIDFFIYFTHECSELYAFSWEHFPLFKWLINELIDEK